MGSDRRSGKKYDFGERRVKKSEKIFDLSNKTVHL